MRNDYFGLIKNSFRLSDRETEIVRWLFEGKFSHKDIASAMGIKPSTVSNHLARILVKSSSRSKTELVVKAARICIEASDQRHS